MPLTNRSIFQSKTAALMAADQDEGVFEDVQLAPRPAWT
jgi:hypothetical protein